MLRSAQIRLIHYQDIDQVRGSLVRVFPIQLPDVAVEPQQTLPGFPLGAALLSAFPSSEVPLFQV